MEPKIDCYWKESFGRKIVNTEVLVLDYSPNGQLTTERTKSQNPALLYMMTLGTKQSREKVGQLLNHLAKIFGYVDWISTPWERIRQPEMLALKTKWEIEKKSPATINLALSVLKGVARQAWMENLMTDHEFTVIQAIKGARGTRATKGRALTPVESSRLIVGCEMKADVKGVRDAAIIALGIGCGLRRAEIASLRTSSLNPEEQSILVMGKGNKERTVYCSNAVWQRVMRWKDLRVEADGVEELFCSVSKGGKLNSAKSLTEDAIFKILRSRAKEFGLEIFAPHDLRRTYATRLFELGGDVNVVRQAMGHASILTTQRYDKRGEEAVKQLSKRVSL